LYVHAKLALFVADADLKLRTTLPATASAAATKSAAA
jgi:hypothetical protein